MFDVVILFEHPQRDLENALMLKTCMEANGYKCDVVKYPFVNPLILQLKYRNKTKCVIVHSLYSDRVIYNLVYWIFGKAEYIFNLQCEQLHSNQDEIDINSYAWPKDHAKKAYHVCWGEKIVAALKRNGISHEHLLLTGPIQMDVWRDSFSGFFMPKNIMIEKFALNPKLRIALFISSFSYANLSDIADRQLRMTLGDQKVTRFAEISAVSQREILNWFKRYLSEHKDIILIYRKHPAEDINGNAFRELKAFENFRIISELPINEWIHNSDILLNWYSTSGVEAYFAQKPCIVLRPVEIPIDEDIAIFKNANVVTQYADFESAMLNSSDCTMDSKIVNQYYNVDKVPSYYRLSKEIDCIIKTGRKFIWDEDLMEVMRKKYAKQCLMRFPIFVYSVIIEVLRKGRKRFGFIYNKDLLVRINRRQLECDRRVADNYETKYIQSTKSKAIRSIILGENKDVF